MAKLGRPYKNKPEDAPPENETDQAGSLAQEVEQQAGDERAARVQLSIEDLLDQCSDNDGMVSFKKVDMLSGSDKHLEKLPVATVGADIFEFVRLRYGGGKYKATFSILEGTSYREITTRVIDLDATIQPGSFYDAQKKEPEKDGTAAVIEAVLEKMGKRGDGEISTSQMLLLMMKQQQEASNQMMTMFTTVIGAISKGAGGGQGIDMLNALAVFDKLKGNSGDMVKPMLEMMEFARKIMVDRAKKESGDDDSPWAKMLAEAFTAVMARMSGGPLPQLQTGVEMPPNMGPVIRPMPDAPPAPPAGPAFEVSNPTIEEVPITEADDMKLTRFVPIKILAPALLPKIIEAIEGGDAEPEDALDMFNNPLSPIKLTDTQYDELVGILKAETWPVDLFGGDDKIAKHRGWFDKLRELILKEAEEETKGGE